MPFFAPDSETNYTESFPEFVDRYAGAVISLVSGAWNDESKIGLLHNVRGSAVSVLGLHGYSLAAFEALRATYPFRPEAAKRILMQPHREGALSVYYGRLIAARDKLVRYGRMEIADSYLVMQLLAGLDDPTRAEVLKRFPPGGSLSQLSSAMSDYDMALERARMFAPVAPEVVPVVAAVTPARPSPKPKRDPKDVVCFRCQQRGHKAALCPAPSVVPKEGKASAQ